MALFTMTLSEALENNPNENFGLDRYPIFDEAYRPVLNQKIKDRYWNREIGASTIQEFRLWVHRKMSEVMPYYNQMYLSERMAIDPLNTVDIRTIADSTGLTTANGEMSGTSDSTGNSVQSTSADAKSRTVDMMTPQNELAGNGEYATGAQDSISNTEGSSNAENTEHSTNATTSDTTANTSNHSENSTKGYSGSQAALLNEYRKTFLNIDVEVLDDLAPLFMQLWGTGDSFTRPEIRGLNHGFYYRY